MSKQETSTGGELPSTLCPVCLETWDSSDRLPKFLVCHHSICVTCAIEIQKRAKKKRSKTPSAEPSTTSGLQQRFASQESLGSLALTLDEGTKEKPSYVRCPMCRIKTFTEDPHQLQTNFYLSELPSYVPPPVPRLVLWCNTCSKVAAPECGDHDLEPVEEKLRYLKEELIRRTDTLQGHVNESLCAHESHMEVYRWLCGVLRHSHSKVLAALTHAAQYHQALQQHTDALQNLVKHGETLQPEEDQEGKINKLTSLLKDLDIQQSAIIHEVEIPILNDTFQILRTHQAPKGYGKALVVLDADKSVTLSLYGEKERQQVDDLDYLEEESDEAPSSTLKRAMSLQLSRGKPNESQNELSSLHKTVSLKEAMSNSQLSPISDVDKTMIQASEPDKGEKPLMLSTASPKLSPSYLHDIVKSSSEISEEPESNLEKSTKLNSELVRSDTLILHDPVTSNTGVSEEQKNSEILQVGSTESHNLVIPNSDTRQELLDSQTIVLKEELLGSKSPTISNLDTTDGELSKTQCSMKLDAALSNEVQLDLKLKEEASKQTSSTSQDIIASNEALSLAPDSQDSHHSSNSPTAEGNPNHLWNVTSVLQKLDLPPTGTYAASTSTENEVGPLALTESSENIMEKYSAEPNTHMEFPTAPQHEEGDGSDVQRIIQSSNTESHRVYPAAQNDIKQTESEITERALEPNIILANHDRTTMPMNSDLASMPKDGTFGRQTINISSKRYSRYLYDEEPIVDTASLLRKPENQEDHDTNSELEDVSICKEKVSKVTASTSDIPKVVLRHGRTSRRTTSASEGPTSVTPRIVLRNGKSRRTTSASEGTVTSRNKPRRKKRGKKRPAGRNVPKRTDNDEMPQQRPRGRQRSRTRQRAPKQRSSSMCRMS